jgi:hypothetical protein
MPYNWTLWDNFVSAAEELGLELYSKDGGCVYIEVPENIRQKFYVMCWTPLNKLYGVARERASSNLLDHWQMRLKDLKQNHDDFHLEFGAKDYEDGSMFWFPNLSRNASKQDIINAVNIMMDTENFEKYKLMAVIRQESAE